MTNSDPKLDAVKDAILNLMKENEYAGAIYLFSPDHGSYGHFLSPYWSGLKVEGDGIRITFTKGDHLSASRTGHVIFSLRDQAAVLFQLSDRICKEIEKIADVKHTPYWQNVIKPQ